MMQAALHILLGNGCLSLDCIYLLASVNHELRDIMTSNETWKCLAAAGVGPLPWLEPCNAAFSDHLAACAEIRSLLTGQWKSKEEVKKEWWGYEARRRRCTPSLPCMSDTSGVFLRQTCWLPDKCFPWTLFPCKRCSLFGSLLARRC